MNLWLTADELSLLKIIENNLVWTSGAMEGVAKLVVTLNPVAAESVDAILRDSWLEYVSQVRRIAPKLTERALRNTGLDVPSPFNRL